jgi:hypothetical protein
LDQPALSRSTTGLHTTVDTGESTLRRSSLSMSVPVRLTLWALSFCVALALMWQWSTRAGVHNDFTQNVWLPARLVLDGANPFSPTTSQVSAALGTYNPFFTNFNVGPSYHTVYPMWLTLAMTPFGALPLEIATTLWRAANLLLLFWGVAALLRRFNPVFKTTTKVTLAALGVTLFFCLVYRESILTLFIGQFSVIEFGLLVAIMGWLISSQNVAQKALTADMRPFAVVPRQRIWGDALVGVALAVLATKPQAVGLPIVLLCVWALSRRRFTIPVSAIVSFVLMMALPMLFYPNSLGEWLSVVFGKGQAGSQAEVSASVWGLSYQWLGADAPWRMMALAFTVVGVAAILPWWWRDLRDKSSPMPMSLPLTLCMNSVISPYMLGYEHVLLLIPALLYIAAAGLPHDDVSTKEELANKKRLRVAVYIWLAVLPMLVVALQGVLSLESPAIAQSASMLAICWTVRLRWQHETRTTADDRR